MSEGRRGLGAAKGGPSRGPLLAPSLALALLLVALGPGQPARGQAPSPAAPSPAAPSPAAPSPAALSPSPTLPAQRAQLSLSFGFDGAQAPEGWSALEVQVAHSDATPRQAELVVELHQPGLGTPLWRGARPLALSGGTESNPASRREWFQVPLRRAAGLLSVRLLAGDDELAAARRVLRIGGEVAPQPRRVLYVSARPSRGADADILLRSPLLPAEELPQVDLRRPEELPPWTSGYAGADLVVLAAPDLGRASAAQRAALLAWVEEGGAVLLVPGAQPGWFESQGIARLLGGAKVERHSVDRLPNLERRFGALTSPGAARPSFEVCEVEAWLRLSQILGEGAYSDFSERRRFGSSYSLLQAHPRGQGLVLLLALDPASPLLSRWRGCPPFCASLAGSLARAGVRARLAPLSGRDPYLDPELFPTLDSNQRPPSGIVLALILVYIVVVGPVNVFLVRRARRAPTLLAWTVPLCALAFTLVVVVVGLFVKGIGVVAWRGTVVTSPQGSARGEVELLLSLRASAAGRHRLDAPAGVGLLRVVRVEEQLAPQEATCVEGQSLIGPRLETWEQTAFAGRGQLSWEGPGLSAHAAGSRWVVRNGTDLVLTRVALLGPDLRIYSGGECLPGQSVTLERGPLSPARRAAAPLLADALYGTDQPGRRVCERLLERSAQAALGLPGACVVARCAASPLPLAVDGQAAPALDVPLLIAPSGVARGEE